MSFRVDAEQVAGLGEGHGDDVRRDPITSDHDHISLQSFMIVMERKRPAARDRLRLVVAEEDDVVSFRQQLFDVLDAFTPE